MSKIFELNNARKDSDYVAKNKYNKASGVVEVFSALVNGREMPKLKKEGAADFAKQYIEDLGVRASNNDFGAIAELNTLRRFTIAEPLMQELKLLSIFGAYQHVGYDETIEREVFTRVGDRSRMQADGGDTVFPAITKEIYTVPTFTVSGGYAVDYRRIAGGDMERENEGMNQVRTDIRNKIAAEVITRVYKSLKGATDGRYFENAGLTKAGLDSILSKIRKSGKTTILGDYAFLSQINNFQGFQTTLNAKDVFGVSERIMNEIEDTGIGGKYLGSILQVIENPYDVYNKNAAGTDFKTLYPSGLGFIIPTGINSPIATWTQGDLTSFTGNDVATGKVMTRFDMTAAVDVAKGQEYMLGAIYDTNLGGLSL